ncbi:hypothetical protein VHEMI10161 [[Torrubiella] hemipterigena]|uniref:Uncharacterized protein n=1 Tax=[Torrubiella] hemipterigena TaxID=1531966 RepID=A0A0A1TSV5_9HYPO|nr:hypothetical protein VHEMI10161 [[Torrubiella] hemipterigena]
MKIAVLLMSCLATLAKKSLTKRHQTAADCGENFCCVSRASGGNTCGPLGIENQDYSPGSRDPTRLYKWCLCSEAFTCFNNRCVS